MKLPEITDESMRQVLAQARGYTVLILRAGPNRHMPDVERIVWEHGRRNMALRAAGLLPIVCPVGDGGDVCGIGIFDAGLDEVREIMAGDPGVQAGVFTVEVRECRGFPGSALPA